MAYSLFIPLPGLPWYLWPVWPLIFWRIQRLKAWFQAHGGPGAQMMWGVDARGRVTILALSDDLTGRGPAPLPAPGPSRALCAALSGEAFAPPHAAGPAGPHLSPVAFRPLPVRGILLPSAPGLPRPDI